MSYEAAQYSLIPSTKNALAPRGGLAFDGTASTRATSTLTNQAIGTDAFSVSVMVEIPSTNPVSERGIFVLGSSVTSGDAGGSVQGYVTTGGVLALVFRGATSADYRYSSVSTSVVSAFGGKTVSIVMVRSTTTGLSVYINGVLQTLAADGTAGTPPAWTTGSCTSTYLTLGLGSSSGLEFVGKIYSVSLYNLALAQSDVTEIYQLNGAVPERYKFGTQVSQIGTGFGWANGASDGTTIATSNGNGGGGITFTAVAGTRTGGVGAYVMQLNSLGVGSLSYINKSTAGQPRGNNLRQPFRYSLWIRRTAGSIVNMSLGRDSAGSAANNITGITASWQQFSGIAYYTDGINVDLNGELYIGLGSVGAAESVQIDDLIIQPISAVVYLPLEDGTGLTAYDVSTNALNATLTATGVTWTKPVAPASFTAPALTSLTLSGGSSGATLVLGQGTSGVATLTSKGGTAVRLTGSDGGAGTSIAEFYNGSTVTAWVAGGGVFSTPRVSGTGTGLILASNAIGQPLQFFLASEVARFSPTNGNLLIGTTTDITGTGGLHVAGTATATAVGAGGGGAFRVGTNVNLSGNAGGASYFGGNLNVSASAGAELTNTVTNSNAGTAAFANVAASNGTTKLWMVKLGTGYATAGRYAQNAGLIEDDSSAGLGISTISGPLNFYGSAGAVRATLTGAGVFNITNTTSASSSTTGALTIGNGTAATNVAIGAGNIVAGANVQAIGNLNVGAVGSDFASGRVNILTASDTVPGLSFGGSNYGFGVLEKTDGNLYFSRRQASTTNTTWLSVDRATGAATFAGAVTLPATGDLRYGPTLGSGFVTIGDAGTFTLRNASADAYLTANNSGFNVLRAATFAGQGNFQAASPQIVIGAGATAINQIGFLYSSGGQYFGLSGNRNPNSGVFANIAGTHASIDLDTGSGGSSITFRTTATPNTLGNVMLTLASSGKAIFENAAIIQGLTVGLGGSDIFGNVAVGIEALLNNTTGSPNTAIGSLSLYNNTTGSANTAIASASLYNNTTGSSNTAIGYQALYNNTTGSVNNATGGFALYYNTTGRGNTANGEGALYAIEPTSKAISAFADYSATVADTVRATSVGHGLTGTVTREITGTVNYNGSYSVTVINADSFYFTATFVETETGWWSVYSEGNYNTALGANAGSGIVTGSGNTILGANVEGPATDLINNIILGNGTGAIKARHDGTNWTLTGAVTSTGAITAPGVVLSVNTALFSADASLSSYSTTNGVYLNGHAAGWLRLSGSGGGVAQIQLNGGATGSITMKTATANALVLNGTTGAATLTSTSYTTNIGLAPAASIVGAYQVTAAPTVETPVLGVGDGTRSGAIYGMQNGANISQFRFGHQQGSTFYESVKFYSGLTAATHVATFSGTTPSSLTTNGAVVVAGGVGIGGAVTASYLNSVGGSAFNQFGSGTRTKATLSGASGEVAFDNGTVDSPGVHFYYGNNANYGIDATASSGLRLVKSMDEAGGTVVASFTDTAATFASAATATKFNATDGTTFLSQYGSGVLGSVADGLNVIASKGSVQIAIDIDNDQTSRNFTIVTNGASNGVGGAVSGGSSLFTMTETGNTTFFSVTPGVSTISAAVIATSLGLSENLFVGGLASANRWETVAGTLPYSATPSVNFTSSGLLTLTLTGNAAFNPSSNIAAGRGQVIRIVGDTVSRTLSFPAGWVFIGGSAPTSIAANKTGILSVTSFGTSDVGIIAAWSVQS
jgi:hypothetical protein